MPPFASRTPPLGEGARGWARIRRRGSLIAWADVASQASRWSFSTARDVLRFGQCLVEGRIVAPEILAEMSSSHTDHIAGAQTDYGYGLIREKSADGVFSIGHGGIASGVNFEYRYFPERSLTLVAFSNQDNGAYDSLRKTATRLITGER
ncbi:MAG: serine hydrolase [Candidatus Eiseniibacteriota bacterium]